MINMQEIIVATWLVPVLGFIVLPFVWTVCATLYRVVERSMIPDMRGFVALNDRDAVSGGKAENRGRLRIHIQEGRALVDEECDCCKAVVSNISNHGICLRNIPRKMYLESNLFRVIFRTREKDYSLTAKPVWKKLTGQGYMLGAFIDPVPEAWNDFVKGLSKSFSTKPA